MGSRPAGAGAQTWVALGLCALLVALGLVLAFAPADRVDRPTPGYVSRDLDGNQVQWERPPDVTGARVRKTGDRFVAPRQDLSVPLLSTVAADGQINPPTLTAAYRYRDLGLLLDRRGEPYGTLVAMHAVRGGRGPGNAFVELRPGTPGPGRVVVRRGDVLLVGPDRYRVTGTLVDTKQAVAANNRVWSAVADPTRLVVITCLLDPTVPLADQQNLVVLALRAGLQDRSPDPGDPAG